MKERTIYLIFLMVASMLMILFDHLGARSRAVKAARKQKIFHHQQTRNNNNHNYFTSSSSLVNAFSMNTNQAIHHSNKIKMFRILCYGDSLTAGTSPPLNDLFPYAPHLQNSFNNNQKQLLNNDDNLHSIIVHYCGLPGWTAQRMMESINDPNVGLSTILKQQQQQLYDLVIILAGTNDVGDARFIRGQQFMNNEDTTSQQQQQQEAAANAWESQIINNIIALHQTCRDHGVPNTLAIGIPPSGFQTMYPTVRQRVQNINRAIQQHALTQQSRRRMHYTDFFFSFSKRQDTEWSPDGLHLRLVELKSPHRKITRKIDF